jgi:hypothetical protein
MNTTRPALLLAVITLAGCESSRLLEPTTPDFTERPGLLIDGPPPTESLVTDAVVTQGTPFLVTATSFGSSNCTQALGYSVFKYSMRVEVQLRDWVAEGPACTRDFQGFPRVLIVQFDQPGAAEVIVIGRDGNGAPTQIRRTVTILGRE